MYQRYTCREGDKTTNGGTIRRGEGPRMVVDDVPAAVEGDPVACPACGTIGRIVCVGPRSGSFLVRGRQLALSDDECACLCSPRPRLIASQDRHANVCGPAPGRMDPARLDAVLSTASFENQASRSTHRAPTALSSLDRSFHLILQTCDAGGRPHADLRYRKCSATMPETQGETTAGGATRQLVQMASGTARAAFGIPSMEVTP
ncbi:PAAR domain-containing protein [Luteibacter sp.]|jgi:uncharacterized Zn-binding protein involved in type VI secretion|uniref:PAAR domain-containing protein n=1 Tax=Luteibacter sp. TaxID=1886636 RepID=UPI002F42240F